MNAKLFLFNLTNSFLISYKILLAILFSAIEFTDKNVDKVDADEADQDKEVDDDDEMTDKEDEEDKEVEEFLRTHLSIVP